MPTPGYLAGVQQMCRERGALLIVDEVQTGLGRTGTVWYHTQEDVEPDLVVAGKALSGGIYPITATLMTAELHAFFDTHPFAHVSTFGGAELGCVAALTALDIIEEPGFLERVRSVGEQIESALAGPGVEVRRRGMFTGLRFDDPNGGVAAAQHLIGAGVFAVFANHDLSVLQFLPPLTISDDELDWLLTTTGSVRQVSRMRVRQEPNCPAPLPAARSGRRRMSCLAIPGRVARRPSGAWGRPPRPYLRERWFVRCALRGPCGAPCWVDAMSDKRAYVKMGL